MNQVWPNVDLPNQSTKAFTDAGRCLARRIWSPDLICWALGVYTNALEEMHCLQAKTTRGSKPPWTNTLRFQIICWLWASYEERVCLYVQGRQADTVEFWIRRSSLLRRNNILCLLPQAQDELYLRHRSRARLRFLIFNMPNSFLEFFGTFM